MPDNLSAAGVSWKLYRNKALGGVGSPGTVGDLRGPGGNPLSGALPADHAYPGNDARTRNPQRYLLISRGFDDNATHS